jgi:septum site-determining protein MinC
MSVNLSEESAQVTAFELKGSTFTLPLLKLLVPNMELVSGQLAHKVKQAPDFFRNTPVIIDLQSLSSEVTGVDFPLLVGLLRGYGMIPIGVRGGNSSQNDAAHAMELAILADGRPSKPERSSRSGATERSSSPETMEAGVVVNAAPPGAGVETGSRMITRPVRSGQRVYAPVGDLVILSQVSSGAEVLAAGNIHVYGALRGRALAGVKGNRECRIFCHDLQAELVSVAGNYRISEHIEDSKRGKPVQIYLKDDALIIDEL